jgi:hypothetical protein
MAFSDARNERDRAEGDTSGKSSGGGGAKARDAERRNREAMSRNGPRGAGSSTAADHLVAIGKARTPSIPAGGVAQGNYPTQDAAYSDYSKAVGQHATRGWMDKLADALAGGFYDPKEPMAGNPRSFADGDFHSTTNPGSVMGALLGVGAGPIGSLVGKIAGPAYTKAGLPEVWHGGYDQPDMRGGIFGNTDNPMGASMADIGGGHTYASGSSPGTATAGRPSQPGGGTGNAGANGAFRPQMPSPTANPNVAKANALAGPTQPMQAPEWWRMAY